MNRRSNFLFGSIFVIIGILFLLKNLNIVQLRIFNIGYLMSNFWATLFLIIPGLAFHYSFFSGNRRSPGLLVPGGIFLVVGVTCQLSGIFNAWGILWPGYILAVAFGLFQLYLYGTRDKGLLIPVGILGGLSLIFFTTFSLREIFSFNVGRFLVPVIFILIGLIITFNGRKKQ